MTKLIKTKTDHEVEGKIIYNEDILYKLDLPTDLHPVLKEGTEIEEGDLIKPKTKSEEDLDLIEIEYKGVTELLPGQHVKVGDTLYTNKKLFKKHEVKSEVSGVVKEVTEDLIKIQEQSEDEETKLPPFKTPFGGKITKVHDNYMLLNFSAVQVNLFESKAGSAVGPIRYISSDQIRERKTLTSHIEKSVIVTEQITAELYPMLSTLGVGAIIANSIDYSLFKNMIILAVPIGIISGFGYTPNEKGKSEVKPILTEDEALIKYIKSIEGKTVWVDGDYGRLIIPETREPASLKRHHWKLNFGV